MKPTPDRLVLSLIHRPLSVNGLASLVDATGRTTLDMMNEMEHVSKKREVANPDANDPNLSPKSSTALPSGHITSPIVHVMVTGSPSTTKPGLTFNDWEKQWTEGEQILARVVHTIGLNKFHRIAKNGEVQLKGKLIDVKNADFTTMYKDGSLQSHMDQRERISCELSWIAKKICDNLSMYHADTVQKATILYPISNPEDTKSTLLGFEMDGIEELLLEVFQREWAEKNGPLNGIELSFKAVTER